MEEAMIRHYPAILEDSEYLERRPIGIAYEKAVGYEVIFNRAGFRRIEDRRERMTFVSIDEEEWWRQMKHSGRDSLIEKIEKDRSDQLQKVKEAICVILVFHGDQVGRRPTPSCSRHCSTALYNAAEHDR
jgi:hypothetical protein